MSGPRRWLAPEVVQTSSMDCGPAALKCLLEGHGIPVSYGRLREACQTSVDGTSIDAIEAVANHLGLAAEQVLVPADHVMLPSTTLPAIVVVRHADEATHFVVLWRRVRGWVQVMDPAIGRRWLREATFRAAIYRHGTRVPAAAWHGWARSAEAATAWRERLAAIGVAGGTADRLLATVTAADWQHAAALDAAIRLVTALVDARALSPGSDAARLIAALADRAAADPFTAIPEAYWSAVPAGHDAVVRGAVLVTIAGRHTAAAPAADLPPELAAALAEPPATPLRTLVAMLRADGLVAPVALMFATALAAGALMLEALLFRGLIDVAQRLPMGLDRLTAGVALLVFIAVLLTIELATGSAALRMGRALEVRLRIALLAKLPRLADRYFQSRPISDMADRSHNIHGIRSVPGIGLRFVETVFELALTALAIALIAPDSGLAAIGVALLTIAMPLAIQPVLNERDLRVRNHAGALHCFYLDSILGLAPIRAHGAQRAVARQHEGLLVEWAHAMRRLARTAVTADGAQALIGTMAAAALVVSHLTRGRGVGGADLLLVFWALKLPGLGSRLAGLAQSYPGQRNVLLRLVEPLDAREEPIAGPAPTGEGPAAITFDAVDVVAGGHPILTGLSVRIAPGEHVAIVGTSGAGKSTLLGLLLGWHVPAAGTVTIDGAALCAAALRATTAWVDPAIQLWNHSLLDNLLYAATNDAIGQVGPVMAAARLRGIARALPEGLQTMLGEGGGLLSGGEGQRVRFGRALMVADPRLVLLDEPFRGLDRGQRETLLAEARVWWAETTLLCVTHDLAETRAFDRVLVIEDGRLVEDGAPAVLAAAPSRYRDLLDAETAVQDALRKGTAWRQLTMVDGLVVERAS
ncbi:cysteine peptidase family C39 domain-containing protein [Sphingomonas aerolata]|uniref:cysteine peptidase family C39 domain-containing protein n=1 Tax=Sphingomonas aerolata TaxID=185951 RepID=UPI002FE011C7